METWFLVSALLVFIFLLDDCIIDFTSLIFRLAPTPDLDSGEVTPAGRQQRLAIMVANWKEQDVIEDMVHANAGLLVDGTTHLFLGVYPNDLETREVAESLALKFENVQCVINSCEGPTYKGQMLDEVINGILQFEVEAGFRFDGFVLHDSEDLIDRGSLDLQRRFLPEFDFIQTPVLSFALGKRDFVGATYLDEFAESHSKDMLVREKLGAAIPSAGVGTCLKRRFVLFFRELQGGLLFPHKDLTEDYILGLRGYQFGFKSKFACVLSSAGPLIATREFFPNGIVSSIRQKSRWTLGIAFQGWQRLGWFGSIIQRYFLWRDRKALIAPFNTLNCLALFTCGLVFSVSNEVRDFQWLLVVNLILIGFRLTMRAYWVHFHYGWQEALLVVVRWPLAIFINTMAGLVAYKDFIKQNIFGAEVKWKKTQHRFIAPPVPINTKKVGS